MATINEAYPGISIPKKTVLITIIKEYKILTEEIINPIKAHRASQN